MYLFPYFDTKDKERNTSAEVSKPSDFTEAFLSEESSEPLTSQYDNSSTVLNDSETLTNILCKELIDDKKSFDASIWVNHISQLAENRKFRLSYSEITGFVFSLINGQSMELLDSLRDNPYEAFLSNLDNVYDIVNKDQKFKDENFSTYKMILKFRDHVKLAVRQESEYRNWNSKAEEQIKTRVSEATKEITGQFVGLIGIFTALSFVVFGGINSLNSIIETLEDLSKTNSVLPTIISSITWAFCMMNILFGFMYFVLRVIDRKGELANQKGGNIVQRYPAVFLTNYILLASFSISCFAWFSQLTGLGINVYTAILESNTTSFFVISLIIIVVLIIIALVLVLMYKPTKKKDKESGSNK